MKRRTENGERRTGDNGAPVLCSLFSVLLLSCGGGSSGGPANPAPADAARPDEPRTITVQPRMTMTVARYAPGESRYAIDRVDTLTVQYPNAAQTQVVQRSAWVRVSIAPGPSSEVIVTLDSVRAGTLSRDSLRLADGSRWTGRLVDGRLLQGLTPREPNAMAEEMVGGTLAELLMPLPEGGARGGFSWRDTVLIGERIAGAEIATTAIRDVNAEAQQQPTEALRLSSTAALDGKGRSTRFGGEIGVLLTGTRTRSRQLSPTGQLLAVEGRDSLALTFDVSSVGQTVPATQIGRVSIERIPGPR